MKGIILAGGKATRLYPVTKAICKQLLPVYDKPLIYYPLSVLMLVGIRDILIISTPRDTPRIEDVLGEGKDFGLRISYAVQKTPRGIAEAFILAEDFIGKDTVCLILGDNILYGHNLKAHLQDATQIKEGGVIFCYNVKYPQQYGIIEIDNEEKIISIEEKPKIPKSNWAVCGLYFYDNDVIQLARKLEPSPRGELEITDINKEYLKRGKLKVKILGRGYAWLDTGTHEALIDAALFIKTIEERQGLKIGCIEEVAYRMGYINGDELRQLAALINTSYGEYLRSVAESEG